MMRAIWLCLVCYFPLSAQERFTVQGPEHAGEAIACDLPIEEHLRNGVGRDGLGLCVFTSLELAAKWANEPALLGFRDFMRQHPGGGWPEKLDEYIRRISLERGLPTPEYMQHTGGDPEFLRLALKTGRYVSVTYSGRDGVFYRGPIHHMVNLVHLSSRFAVVQDNNFPGKWLWMSPADFLERWKTGGGWAVVLLNPGPPPIPVANLPIQAAMRVLEPLPCQQICPNGVCKPIPQKEVQPKLQWREDSQAPGFWYLYDGITQLGTYHPDERGYRALQPDGSFGTATEPPMPLPVAVATNYGVNPERISRQASYARNGFPITRQEAFTAVGTLSDDSGKARLTIIGEESLRQQVLRDMQQHPQLRPWLDQLLVQAYPANHWAVRKVGLQEGIILQSAADAQGRAPVQFRLRQYSQPEQLAVALRKTDPNYDAKRDPDPDQMTPNRLLPDLEQLSAMPGGIWAILGAFACWYLQRYRVTKRS